MNIQDPFQKLNRLLSIQDVLDNVDCGIVIYDRDGNFLFMNSVMVNWRNIPRSEYLKMNVHDFNSVLDVCVFDLIVEQKRPVSRLQYYKNFQEPGTPDRIRIVSGSPVFDGDGELQYVIMMLQDVREFEDRYQRILKQHRILPGERRPSKRRTEIRMVARSPEIRQLLSVTDNVSRLDSNVLLYGESGTGKEVFARYIHAHSSRSDGAMITVNCAAFPENLIESELFGYEKGSFTGASREGKAGLVEAADGGTLFLDEINSLPLGVQGKMLRVIEEKAVQRIGTVKAKKVDFRLIAATNRNLAEMVKAGTFREDLYYRLNVIPLTIPPLRGRKGDIIPLCLYFLHEYCTRYNLKKQISDEVLGELENYSWPGNVRELRNFVERIVVMTPGNVSVISSIPKEFLENNAEAAASPAGKLSTPFSAHPSEDSSDAAALLPDPFLRPALTKESVVEALRECGGNREKTASYLGISRRQLQYKIKEFRLSSRCRYDQ